MQQYHFRAMNTNIDMSAEGKPRDIARGFEKAKTFIEQSEQRFSRFLSGSELCQLNRSAGGWFCASTDMMTVLMLAKQYAEQTNGLFSPAVLPDLERMGYDRTMELIQAQGVLSLPTDQPRKAFLLDAMIIRPEKSLISLPAGMALDLGGIVKGWIAEQSTLILAAYAQVCGVSAGGDMYLCGIPSGQTGWTVGVENPFNPEEYLLTLNVSPGGLATSSTTRRTWKQGDRNRHHLIDPGTGLPAESDWVSVTVTAEHTDECEAYAKALLIAGPEKAREIPRFEELCFVAVTRSGKIVGSKNMMEYVL